MTRALTAATPKFWRDHATHLRAGHDNGGAGHGGEIDGRVRLLEHNEKLVEDGLQHASLVDEQPLAGLKLNERAPGETKQKEEQKHAVAATLGDGARWGKTESEKWEDQQQGYDEMDRMEKVRIARASVTTERRRRQHSHHLSCWRPHTVTE